MTFVHQQQNVDAGNVLCKKSGCYYAVSIKVLWEN